MDVISYNNIEYHETTLFLDGEKLVTQHRHFAVEIFQNLLNNGSRLCILYKHMLFVT